ncbi:hypothetical protein [Paenibacillus sp. 1A_MP2]|uniref:hypothetical protein n=1 Tax=Paenibacillus sp. 1A_MP2 TaxID=3457495 RepID=UPI003FCD6B75
MYIHSRNSKNKHINTLQTLFLLFGILLLLSACGQSQKPSSSEQSNHNTGTKTDANSNAGANDQGDQQNTVPPQEEKDPVQEQLDQLSLDEKVGQMILAGVQGTTLDAQAKQMIMDQKVGALFSMPITSQPFRGQQRLCNPLRMPIVPIRFRSS